MPLGIKPTVDFAFKRIFGSPENVPVLIGLLNAILRLPSPIVHAEILNPFSYQDFASDKLIVLDIRIRDSEGRWYNVEMQVTIFGGLLQRLVYYACSLYVAQLQSGQDYADLRPAISICLLSEILFWDNPVPHHRFRLVDQEHARELADTIEVHTVELLKYNVNAESVATASAIEKWVFFLLHAGEYGPEQLREWLPDHEFQQAIDTIELMASKTEDRIMYDQREKAQRDYLWAIQGARNEGIKIGIEQGIEQGIERGIEQGTRAGKIQLIQQLLNLVPDSVASLLERSPEELDSTLSDLQQQLRSRGL